MQPPFDLIGKHPAETFDFEIQTLAIKELREILGYWLDRNTPGGIVYSLSRFGKSWSIRYFKDHKLPNAEVPIVSARIPRDTSLTKNQFAILLLECFGHADPHGDTAEMKMSRIAEFLEMKAEQSGENAVYIFIDDAHELDESHFAWLCNLYDVLFDDKHIQPCFVLFAEPILKGRKDSFRGRGKTQTIARLMTEEYEFPSITTAEEVQFVLSGYDVGTEFPKGSGWSYTRYFFTEAFERGWRLASQSELLYQTFKQSHEKGNVSWSFIIPMEHLIRALKYILIAYKTTDSAFTGFTFDQHLEAVDFSEYISATSYLARPRLKENKRV